MLAMSVKLIFILFFYAIASEFFEIAHTNSRKILATFLHAKICDLSETSASCQNCAEGNRGKIY
jgi:hypothetical protein